MNATETFGSLSGKLFIGGEFVASAASEMLDVIDPAVGHTLSIMGVSDPSPSAVSPRTAQGPVRHP